MNGTERRDFCVRFRAERVLHAAAARWPAQGRHADADDVKPTTLITTG